MGSGEEQSCKFYLHPTIEERRGWGGTACSKPDFQSCGCVLISPSPSPYPGRRGTCGCGAQWFSPHPAAFLPQAASGAALILLPLLASRCVRGGRSWRRREKREEEVGAADTGLPGPPGRAAAAGGPRTPCRTHPPPPPQLHGSSPPPLPPSAAPRWSYCPQAVSSPVFSEEGGGGDRALF